MLRSLVLSFRKPLFVFVEFYQLQRNRARAIKRGCDHNQHDFTTWLWIDNGHVIYFELILKWFRHQHGVLFGKVKPLLPQNKWIVFFRKAVLARPYRLCPQKSLFWNAWRLGFSLVESFRAWHAVSFRSMITLARLCIRRSKSSWRGKAESIVNEVLQIRQFTLGRVYHGLNSLIVCVLLNICHDHAAFEHVFDGFEGSVTNGVRTFNIGLKSVNHRAWRGESKTILNEVLRFNQFRQLILYLS